MEIFASASFDLHLFQVTVADRGRMKEHQRAQATARQNSAAQWKLRQNASEWSCSVGAQVQLPADGKKVLHAPHSFFFWSPNIYTDVTELTNDLSASCQRHFCVFWRSSILSVLQW